jgi:ribosomal protein S18 acetylase RimI-like enzyme
MKNSFEIITLPAEKWREYKKIRLNALKTDPQAFLSNYERELVYPDSKWKERLNKANEGKTSWMFFAEMNGEVVGMVGGYRSEVDIKNDSAEIWGVYVEPKVRVRGIAKALMAKIVEVLNAKPEISTIKLEVNVDQQAAKKLYEHFGFQTVGTSKIILGDGNEHKVAAMELKKN